MRTDAEARIMAIQSPSGVLYGYTVRSAGGYPIGLFSTRERAYEEALSQEISARMSRPKLKI